MHTGSRGLSPSVLLPSFTVFLSLFCLIWIGCALHVAVKAESQLGVLYSGYVAFGQTQARAAMSSVPLSFSVHPHGEAPNTNMTRFMCYPIMGEWWYQGKYSVVLNWHHCSTWEEKPNFSGQVFLSAPLRMSATPLSCAALRGCGWVWILPHSTEQMLSLLSSTLLLHHSFDRAADKCILSGKRVQILAFKLLNGVKWESVMSFTHPGLQTGNAIDTWTCKENDAKSSLSLGSTSCLANS